MRLCKKSFLFLHPLLSPLPCLILIHVIMSIGGLSGALYKRWCKNSWKGIQSGFFRWVVRWNLSRPGNVTSLFGLMSHSDYSICSTCSKYFFRVCNIKTMLKKKIFNFFKSDLLCLPCQIAAIINQSFKANTFLYNVLQ